VVAGAAVYSKDLKREQQFKTLEGQKLTVENRMAGGVYVNRNAKVTTADVGASNGVVHIIDHVLIPPSRSGCTISVPSALQREYTSEFAALDTNHNGYLDPSEFKSMGAKLADVFSRYRSWGNRRLRGSWGGGSWAKLLAQKWKEKVEALRATKVFKKFDADHNHSISLCEFENAMYHQKVQDDMSGQHNDGSTVVVHD